MLLLFGNHYENQAALFPPRPEGIGIQPYKPKQNNENSNFGGFRVRIGGVYEIFEKNLEKRHARKPP